MIDETNKIIYIDYTTLSLFRSCKEKCRLGSVRGYRPKVKVPALSFGHALHAGIAAFYDFQAGGYRDRKNNWHRYDSEWAAKQSPTRMAEIAFLQDLGFANAELPVTLESDERRSIERGLGLIAAYIDRWHGEPYENLLKPSGEPYIEVGFRYHLTTFAGYDVFYVGYIDRIMYNRHTGRPVVWETKTTTQALSIFVMACQPNYQITGYFPAAQDINPDIRECVWDAVFVSSRKADMQKALTDRFWMYGVDKANDFKRHITTRSKQDISDFRIDAEEDALEYCKWITSDKARWTRSAPTACHVYGGCKFRNRCSVNIAPEDEPRFMAMDFDVEKWEPWRNIVRLEAQSD